MNPSENSTQFSDMRLAQAGEAHAGNSEVTSATTASGAAHESPALLRFDPGVGIWALITFALLLVILKKLAWKPILKSLEDRERTIKQSLEQAQNLQSENARLAQEQTKLLDTARTEASSILASAREASEVIRKQIEQAAQTERVRILASAKQEIEAQKQTALSELRKTTAELSISIAEKLLRQNLDDAKTKVIVDQLIQEVTSGKA
jgi:F-type H+-transporting ATPase subunit b